MPTEIKCFRCGGPHYASACTQRDMRICFKCQKLGHLAKDCPQMSASSAVNSKPSVEKPKAVGRVFTMRRAEAAKSANLVQGSSSINGRVLHTLFDSGASHSFISETCVKELGLDVNPLLFELRVVTFAFHSVVTSAVCQNSTIEVENRKFKVNLICLPLTDIDVILGMDCLSANHILIDCAERKLIFPEDEQPK